MRSLPTLALVCCACAAPGVPVSMTDRPPVIRPALGATPVDREVELSTAGPAREEEAERGRLAEVREPPDEEEEAAPDAFAYWDRDGDGVLSADELTDITVAAWDEDSDGFVDRDEWPG